MPYETTSHFNFGSNMETEKYIDAAITFNKFIDGIEFENKVTPRVVKPKWYVTKRNVNESAKLDVFAKLDLREICKFLSENKLGRIDNPAEMSSCISTLSQTCKKWLVYIYIIFL